MPSSFPALTSALMQGRSRFVGAVGTSHLRPHTYHLPRHPFPAPGSCSYSSLQLAPHPDDTMETHGPLGTLWVGLGLGAFYIALIWINSLLGIFTGPLFMTP